MKAKILFYKYSDGSGMNPVKIYMKSDSDQANEDQAIRAINKGRKKISAKLIINWIRWHEFLESSDLNFRINDAYQAYYARLFCEKHPEHVDKFEFRKLRNEEPGQYMTVESDGQLAFY